MTDILLALDIGGTKTRMVAVTRDGARPFDKTVPSHGWDAEPEPQGARWIADLIGAHLPAGFDIALASFGAQGINNDAVGARLEAELAALGITAAANNDADLIVPAAGFAAGIGVIAGTGSIAVGRDSAGRRLAAGGWGSVIGDEGGAAALVREAARAALAAHDAGAADDGLLAALIADFGVADPERLTRRVNDEPTSDNWAPHCPAVFAAAAAGSALAAGVITAGGAALARLVAMLMGRGATGSDIVLAGSVIVHQPPLRAAFTTALGHLTASWTVHLLEAPPVEGAVFRGRARLGWSA